MAQAEKRIVSSTIEKKLQRECLFFATDLYHHIMIHPEITKHLPPRMPGVTKSHYTENIGKAVTLLWYTFRSDFRGLKGFNLKILTSSKMKENIHEIIEKVSEGEKSKHVFQGIQFLSAVLMEVHIFLFQRNYEEYLSRLPVLWTELFQKHYASRFIDKGGWEPFKSYALDGAKKYERFAKEESMTITFNLCVFTNQKNKDLDQTKEMRIFVVQKSLECIKKNREKSIDIAKRAFAMNDMRRLHEAVQKIANTCDNCDRAREELGEMNLKMSMQLNNFCHQFYDKYEFQRFLIQHAKNVGSKSPPKATEVKKTAEKLTTASTPYPTETTSKFDKEWNKCLCEIRNMLKSVTPPGTDEESIDRMADTDYIKYVMKKIGAMRVTEYDPDVNEDWSKIGGHSSGRPQKHVDPEQMLKDRIQVLEQIQSAKAQGDTPPKESCSKQTVITPVKLAEAGSKSKALELTVDCPSYVAKKTSPEKPSGGQPTSESEIPSEVVAKTSISGDSKAKPPRSQTRSGKGSKR